MRKETLTEEQAWELLGLAYTPEEFQAAFDELGADGCLQRAAEIVEERFYGSLFARLRSEKAAGQTEEVR